MKKKLLPLENLLADTRALSNPSPEQAALLLLAEIVSAACEEPEPQRELVLMPTPEIKPETPSPAIAAEAVEVFAPVIL